MSEAVKPAAPDSAVPPPGVWVPVPQTDDQNSADAWAAAAADQIAATVELDPDFRSDLVVRLGMLARSPLAPPASWRLLYVVRPELGASVWDVAFLRADPSIPLRSLLDPDESGQLGGEVVEFSEDGLEGLQHVSFGLVEDAGDTASGSESIEGHAATVLTRDLNGEATTLVAVCRTVHLGALATSLVPVQQLLASPELEEWVAAAGG